MKKIVLTISRGWIARNLLHNEFYRILREKYKIVILTQAFSDTRFLHEFAHPNVEFRPLKESSWDKGEHIMTKIHELLVYSQGVELRMRYGLATRDVNRNGAWFFLLRSIFKPISKITFLRDVARTIDGWLFQRNDVADFQKFLQTEKPDLVIATHITSNIEAALIKASKKEKIPVWGMPKSWDNPTKSVFRAKADKLIVWNQYMYDRCAQYQNYKPSEMEIVGVPQYDFFFEPTRVWTREKFCEKYGLDPKRKIIVFGSEGKLFPTDKEIAEILHEFIMNNQLHEPAQLLVRPHYGFNDDVKKFTHLIGREHLVVDTHNEKSKDFVDGWDYSDEFSNRFVNTIIHGDIIINTMSSLSLDATITDTPIVSIMFDGHASKPFHASIVKMYGYDWNAAVLKTEGTWHAKNKEELLKSLNTYLQEGPQIKKMEREILRKQFCEPLDGNVGKRYAQLVINFLEK